MNQFDHPLLYDDRPFRVLPFSMMTLALIVLSALFIGHVGLRQSGLVVSTDPGTSGQNGVYEIVIGGINFRVPGGFLRFGEQQRSGVLPGIDLAMAWPTMAPLGNAEDLRNTERHNIIFVGLNDTGQALDTTDLLSSVYQEVFIGPLEHMPSGLVRRRLDPQAGYTHDSVYFDITTGSGFATRCSQGNETVWETCHRDVILTNGLTVTYRFSPELLADWQSLDDAILGFLLMLARSSQDYVGN